MTFSYFTFVHHPIASLAYISLIMAFISLWVHKRIWLWTSFLVIAFAFAFFGKLIDFRIFISLAFLAGAHMILATEVRGWMRILALLVAFLFSLALMGHFFPGFHNWKIAEGIQLSKDAYPYTMYLNFDKPFVGFFPLAFTIPLLQSRFQIRTIAFKGLILTAIGVLILMILSLYFHVVDIDLKFPHISFVWLLANLFFVTIPEEAFFRGFLQREINDFLQTKWSGVFSIVAVSLLFAIFHFGYVKDLNFISLTFIASLVYGSVYHLTRSIECSILCHYLLNVIHFFCFTYPALKVTP